jgi:hypothetical protein
MSTSTETRRLSDEIPMTWDGYDVQLNEQAICSSTSKLIRLNYNTDFCQLALQSLVFNRHKGKEFRVVLYLIPYQSNSYSRLFIALG